jgi:hypothetical protein
MSLYEQISGKRKMEFVSFFGPHKAQILILSKICGKLIFKVTFHAINVIFLP